MDPQLQCLLDLMRHIASHPDYVFSESTACLSLKEEPEGWTNALHTAAWKQRRLLDHFIQRTHTKYQLESHLQPVMMSSVTGGCPLALVILLLVSMDPTATEVVDKVSDCAEFFLEGTPPEIRRVLEQGNIQDQIRYKPICQTKIQNNDGVKCYVKNFMTLYDRVNKIPVFSAYKYKGHKGTRPQNPSWRIHSQLGDNQALNNDYQTTRSNDYNRGHLFPCCHAENRGAIMSTFTLTNAVPQVKTFNSGSWNRMEKCIKCVMDKYCLDKSNNPEAFVVTGAIPSKDDHLNNRVNIPQTLWTAFCCHNQMNDYWLASAHWGANSRDNTEIFINTRTLYDMNLEFNFSVMPFANTNCLHASTGSQYYPDVEKDCDCPPQPSKPGIPRRKNKKGLKAAAVGSHIQS